MLTTASFAKKKPASATVLTHCFIHPEWEKNFNPKYDVALLFLSESLNLSQEQIDKLLKLKIFNEEKVISVVGNPNGSKDVNESKGDVYTEDIDSKEMIYHLANTLPGSSGSPIVSECMHIIGTHTRGVNEKYAQNRCKDESRVTAIY